MGKWVYRFGDGRAEGTAAMRALLGGKGANLAEMCESRAAGAPRLHHHHRGLRALLRSRPQLSGRPRRAGRCGHRRHRADRRQAIRRCGRSAAGLRPLRCADLDARHDGHRAQSRPQRPHRAGPGQGQRQPALRLRQLSPLHPDVRRRGAGRRPLSVRREARGPRSAIATARFDTELDAEALALLVEQYKAIVAEDTGKPFPQDTREQLLGAPSAPCSARG